METDDQINQLFQYFVFLTEKHLIEHFGSDTGKILSETFKSRFKELYDANQGLFPDLLGKRHGINPIFVMALDDILKDQDLSFEDLKVHVLTIYKTILKDYLSKQADQLESSDDAWRGFVEMAKVGNKQLYENAYFKLKKIQEDDTRFGFDIRRCLYFEVFKKNGRPKLGPILCEYDYILASNIEKWIKFERNETIANGDSRCTFRYFRV